MEQAYAVVSALPQRAENQLHVSLMENYPGTLQALGEPIRQVLGAVEGLAGPRGWGEWGMVEGLVRGHVGTGCGVLWRAWAGPSGAGCGARWRA